VPLPLDERRGGCDAGQRNEIWTAKQPQLPPGNGRAPLSRNQNIGNVGKDSRGEEPYVSPAKAVGHHTLVQLLISNLQRFLLASVHRNPDPAAVLLQRPERGQDGEGCAGGFANFKLHL